MANEGSGPNIDKRIADAAREEDPDHPWAKPAIGKYSPKVAEDLLPESFKSSNNLFKPYDYHFLRDASHGEIIFAGGTYNWGGVDGFADPREYNGPFPVEPTVKYGFTGLSFEDLKIYVPVLVSLIGPGFERPKSTGIELERMRERFLALKDGLQYGFAREESRDFDRSVFEGEDAGKMKFSYSLMRNTILEDGRIYCHDFTKGIVEANRNLLAQGRMG